MLRTSCHLAIEYNTYTAFITTVIIYIYITTAITSVLQWYYKDHSQAEEETSRFSVLLYYLSVTAVR